MGDVERIRTEKRVNERWQLLHKKLETDGGIFTLDRSTFMVLFTPPFGIVERACIDTFEIDSQKTDKQLDALLKARLTGIYLDIGELARQAVEKIAGLE